MPVTASAPEPGHPLDPGTAAGTAAGTGSIATTRDGLRLLPMRRGDLGEVLTLMRANADHLSQHSDFGELAQQTPETYSIALASPDGSQQYAFRIVEDDVLIGGIALVPVPVPAPVPMPVAMPQEPRHFSVGYWLAASACGRGNATLALRAIAIYAREHLHAADLSARVRPTNAASSAVLQRAGFQQHPRAHDAPTDRFHRALAD